MTINIPNNPVENTFLIGSFYKDRPSIGIILEEFSSSQISFETCFEVYNFLEQTNQIELLFFRQDWEKPQLRLPVGCYNISALAGYRGNIVTTTIDGIIDALNVTTIKKIMWYIYSPFEIINQPQDEIGKLLENPNIIKICRNPLYKKLIYNTYPSALLEEDTMPIIDINKICQILLGTNKNANKTPIN